MASDSGSQNPGSRSIMTFYPTKEEFQNFSRYMAYMESQGAHRAGLAKIVPPKEWKPRRSYDDIDDLVIPAPIQQVVTGQSGLFTQYNIQKKPMTVREFRKTANSDKFCSPRYINFEELERKYWKNITFNAPIYGADVNGTFYDPDVTEWNIGRLNTILDTVERDSGIVIEGVNTPYLYFGMWKTTFAWHTEDMDLYSINYLHFGEPKSWYCVPPEHGKRLERLAKGFFPGSSQNCEAFLRHKMTLISPSILKKYGIPFEKMTQEAGQFIVTFPYGYHAGFNHGFNCAESTNFATQRWIEYGKHATLCSCRKDTVKISMDVFVQKYQPDRYELWKAGKDNASIDHSKPTPEAAEFLGCEGVVHSCEDADRSEGEKKSLSKQRIGTKRHRVCLELPEEVLSKEEEIEREEEGEEQETAVGKKARLTLQTFGQGAVERGQDTTTLLPAPLDVPVPAELKLEDTVKELSSLEIYPKGGFPLGGRYTISLMARGGPSPSPRPQAPPLQFSSNISLPPPKPGVASLLFHRTLSPTEALRVHSYAKEHYVAPGIRLQERKPDPPPTAPANEKYVAPVIRLQERKPDPPPAAPANKKEQYVAPVIRLQERKPDPPPAAPANKKEHYVAPVIRLQERKPDPPPVAPANKKEHYVAPVIRLQERKPDPSPAAPANKKEHYVAPVIRLQERKPDPSPAAPANKKEHYVAPVIRLQERKPDPPTAAPTNKKGADVEPVCKNMKSKRLPLSKLPRLHPLIKDCLSDEELPEPAPEDEDWEEGEEEEEQQEVQESETWAKPLAQLWQNRPHNLKAEKEYNQRMGLQAPYCAVCMLFQTYWQSEYGGSSSHRSPVALGDGLKTTPLIPEMCFTTDKNSKVHFSSPYVEEDGSSRLISCSQCSVRVHTSCYGVPPESVSQDWKCARCEANAMTEDCCLCSLRGGALHRANNDKWVHVLCAVAVLEARFVNLADRSPVDLSGIPLQRCKLKCFYCKRRVRKASGCCVQCSHGRCPTSFHATCALAAGVLMQPDDWPFVVYVTCWRHRGPVRTARNKASMRELDVGQKVICKHKNLRYYQCEVVELTQATFYEVIFDDGSFSDNLFPEDIENRDCLLLGPPPEGEVVQVRWTDGLLYGAKFVAAHIIPMYLVEFEDSSQLSAKRDDVYTLDEELPKRVKSRLSVASDMRFDGIFNEKEVKRNSKRQRVINSRYREDYIEPVIYRAIME